MKNYSTVVDISAHIENISTTIQPAADGVELFVSFDNLDFGVISAIKFKARGFDSFGEPVSVNGEEQFLILFQDLKIDKNTRAQGLRYKIPAADIRRIELEESLLRYDDGRVFTYTDRKELKINTEEYEEGEVLDALREGICGRMKYVPRQYERGWFCGCGYFNRRLGSKCALCGTEKDVMFSTENADVLNAAIEKHRQNKAERAVTAAKKAKEKKDKKKKVTISVLAIFVAVIGIAALWFFNATTTETKRVDGIKIETTYKLHNHEKIGEVFYQNGKKTKEIVYKHEIIAEETLYNDEGFMTERRVYNEGKLVKETIGTGDGGVESEKEYDSSGNLVRWYAGGGETHEYKYNGKKQVKTETITYDYSSEKITETHKFEYDSTGNHVTDKKYDKNGKLESVTKTTYLCGLKTESYEYDKDNKLVREIKYEDEGEILKETKYGSLVDDDTVERIEDTFEITEMFEDRRLLRTYYYKDGTKTEESYWGEVDSQIREKTEYNKKGYPVKITSYSTENNFETLVYEYSILEYDSKGNNIKETTYDADDNLKSISKMEYNAKKQLIKEKEYDSDKKLWLIKTYKYNAQGKVSRFSRYNPDGTLDDYTDYYYDDDGNEIKKVTTNSYGNTSEEYY